MISNKRNRTKYILRASTKLGNMPALSNQHTRPRRNFPHEPSPESLRSMIKRGKLGIFRLDIAAKIVGDKSISRNVPMLQPVCACSTGYTSTERKWASKGDDEPAPRRSQ